MKEVTTPCSLAESGLEDAVRAMISAALEAVEPRAAVRRVVSIEGELLRVAGQEHDLSGTGRVCVFGAGKASQAMVAALWELLGERIDWGIAITKRGSLDPDLDCGPVAIVEASHPLPDSSGVDGTRRLVEMAAALGSEDLALVLVSGGASALLTLPAAGLALEDLQRTTDLLLRSGVPIEQLNAVRKHLSAIKGGLLARAVFPASSISLILSDVIGDPLDGIGSGPTAPDPTTYADALDVFLSRGILEEVPRSVRRHLEEGCAGALPETPAQSDPLFEKVRNVIVGSNTMAAEAAVAAAAGSGLQAKLHTTEMRGEAREVGRQVGVLAREMLGGRGPVSSPGCLVLGGETTVTVRGRGLGGRNTELALAAALEIEGLEGAVVVTLATDGGDGPTDAAGAIATGETVARAREMGLDPASYLAENDSYRFFAALGDLIRTGPTLTNVADLVFVIAS